LRPGLKAVSAPGQEPTLIAVPSTAAITAVATRPSTAAACPAASFFTRASDIHRQTTPIQLCPVERLDGFLSFFRIRHGYEPKSARTAGVTIHHELGFQDRAVGAKGIAQIIFSGVEG
jgi:hypothetical protein